MADHYEMDIDGTEPAPQAAAPATGTSPGRQHNTEEQHSAPAESGLFAQQTEIISQLEVDSNRSDNDSSLGSEITS